MDNRYSLIAFVHLCMFNNTFYHNSLLVVLFKIFGKKSKYAKKKSKSNTVESR